MSELFLYVSIAWLAGLALLLALVTLGRRNVLNGLVAVDSAGLVLVGVLALVSALGGQGFMLDVAALVALLSVVQVVAIARYAVRRKVYE